MELSPSLEIEARFWADLPAEDLSARPRPRMDLFSSLFGGQPQEEQRQEGFLDGVQDLCGVSNSAGSCDSALAKAPVESELRRSDLCESLQARPNKPQGQTMLTSVRTPPAAYPAGQGPCCF